MKFEEKVIPPENFSVLLSEFDGARNISSQNRAWNFAGDAGAQRDKPFVVLAQKFLIDARFVVETVDSGAGNQLDEIFVAGVIFGEQNQMKIFFAVDFGADFSIGLTPRSSAAL